jgi:hypothetical protein
MTKQGKLMILLGMLIFLLLNPPLLQIFNHDTILGGVPVLILYLHGVWLLAIIGLYILGKRLSSRE